MVGKTILIASGSNGKFGSRLDLEVAGVAVKGHRYRLIPVFSDVIAPDPEVAGVIDRRRAPYEHELKRELGRSETLPYRRANFNGTLDPLICHARRADNNPASALSPGFPWGTTPLPAP